RVLARGGGAAHAARASRWPCGRRDRPARGGRAAHRSHARVRALGDGGQGRGVIRFDLVDARIELVVEEADAEALRYLSEQFTDLLAERDAPAYADEATMPDPALARLFPDPIPDDAAESAEVRELTRPALIDHKRV